jgi:hypothetical protein
LALGFDADGKWRVIVGFGDDATIRRWTIDLGEPGEVVNVFLSCDEVVLVSGTGDFAGSIGVSKFFDVRNAGIGVCDLSEIGVSGTRRRSVGVVVGIRILSLISIRIGHRQALAGVVIGKMGCEGGAGAGQGLKPQLVRSGSSANPKLGSLLLSYRIAQKCTQTIHAFGGHRADRERQDR